MAIQGSVLCTTEKQLLMSWLLQKKNHVYSHDQYNKNQSFYFI